MVVYSPYTATLLLIMSKVNKKIYILFTKTLQVMLFRICCTLFVQIEKNCAEVCHPLRLLGIGL